MRAPFVSRLAALALLGGLSGCVVKSDVPAKTYRMSVTLTMGDGSPLPTEDNSLCLDLRGIGAENRPASSYASCPETAGLAPGVLPDSLKFGHDFLITVEALDNDGNRDTSFNGYARVTVRPGTVQSVSGDESDGRNIKLTNGVSTAQTVRLIGTFGPTRVEVQDLGYVPGDPTAARKPQCADGIDNNGNGLIDYPADPGCEFADDDTEDFGTAAAGVSPIVWFRYPLVADLQGYGEGTPFQSEGVVAETRPMFDSNLIVTRILSQGFEVSDVIPGATPGTYTVKDWGSVYVFNFGLPDGIEVCDRVTYLAGSMDVFFGYTEMDFPSYDVHPWNEATDGPCQVPQPKVLGPGDVASKTDAASLQKLMSTLVEVDGAHVATHFGPGELIMPGQMINPPYVLDSTTGAVLNDSCGGTVQYKFDRDHSNCDINGDGTTNFETDTDEANCFCYCFYADAECSEWSSYAARGNFRLVLNTNDPTQSIQANTQTVEAFDPRLYVGQELPRMVGTLSKFSGGNLNWTIETRCTVDLAYCPLVDDPMNPGQKTSDPSCLATPPAPEDFTKACVLPRTSQDNDSASN